MINWYYEKMYIAPTIHGFEDRCPQNIPIINTDTRSFRLFKWAMDKAMYYLFNGDHEKALRFLDIADAYFKSMR